MLPNKKAPTERFVVGAAGFEPAFTPWDVPLVPKQKSSNGAIVVGRRSKKSSDFYRLPSFHKTLVAVATFCFATKNGLRPFAFCGGGELGRY